MSSTFLNAASSGAPGGRNRRWPVKASHSTTPAAKTSVLRSTADPNICSGDMYEALPEIWPVRVTCISLVALATPKSRTLTSPSLAMMMFCGETSRCTKCKGRPTSSTNS